uniref:UvrD-like helicase C-terminal domain-containing protein n=1 Tax=Macrostomum lignano TaxID=282301 RepID=A0A1I8ILM1_9PLAT
TARSLCRLSLGLNRPPLRRRGLLPNFLDRCLSAGGTQAPAEFFTPLFESAAEGKSKDRRLMLDYLRLCLDLAKSCSVPAMLRLLEPLVVGADDPEGATRTSQGLLLELLRLSVAPEGSEQLRLPWRRLPVVPTAFEMEGRGSAVSEFLLPAIPSDCFDRVVKGTRAWQRGELDSRDMSVYTAVRLCGVRLSSSCGGSWPMTLGLRSKLLPGNLLCISPDANFDPAQMLWATVAFRDSKQLQRESVIWIELCSDCNPVSDVQAFQSMLARQSSGMLMAESPTLFKACEPVLRSLQQFQADRLPFAEGALRRPDYVARYLQRQAGAAAPAQPGHRAGAEAGQQPGRAFSNALHRRLAIIIRRHRQEPPRGAHRPPADRAATFRPPALVLAYKNRALDDFLSDLLQHFPADQVLR